MALPVGHAAVGLAAAAVVARATQTDPSLSLWLGAVIASGVPDLDMIAVALGYRGPRFHRGPSHSLVVLAALAAGVWLVIEVAEWPINTGMRWAWIAALVTHPLVDISTTGDSIRSRGYAIPLWWPLSSTRFSLRRPFFASLELERVKTVRQFLVGIRPEFTHLVLPAAMIVAATLIV